MAIETGKIRRTCDHSVRWWITNRISPGLTFLTLLGPKNDMRNSPELHRRGNNLVFPLDFAPAPDTFAHASIKLNTPWELGSRIKEMSILGIPHALRGWIPAAALYAIAQSARLTAVKNGDSTCGKVAAVRGEFGTSFALCAECVTHRGQLEITNRSLVAK